MNVNILICMAINLINMVSGILVVLSWDWNRAGESLSEEWTCSVQLDSVSVLEFSFNKKFNHES